MLDIIVAVLLFTGSIGVIIGSIAFYILMCCDMDTQKALIICCVTALVTGCICTWAFNKVCKTELDRWNNGVCVTCNTDYHLVASDNSFRYYSCENNHTIKSVIYLEKNR